MTEAGRAPDRDLWLVALGAALLYLPWLGARDLWNPNEPTYGQAVREMIERADWLVPTVNGEWFAEKPPLYFWLARLFAAIGGGASEFALRLPSALFGIAGAVLQYLLVRPDGGRNRARIAAALFATMYLVLISARSIQMDLMLTVCALGAIVAGTRTIDDRLSPGRGWMLAGLATGLGFLAKGPLILGLAGLPILAYAIARGRFRRLLDPAILAGTAVAIAIVVPWVVALALRGQLDVFVELAWRQTFVRAVDPWDHARPWWYFLREFWNELAPWSLFVPLAFALPGRTDAERRLDRLSWAWLLGVIALISLSASKRSPYIMPIAPAAAALVSGLVVQRVAGRLEAWRDRMMTGWVAFYAVLFLAAGYLGADRGLSRYPEMLGPAVLIIGLLLIGGAAIGIAAIAPRTRRTTAPGMLFVVVASLWLAFGFVQPSVDIYKSPRGFCEEVQTHVGPDDELHAFATWRWRAGYAFYSDRPVTRVTDLPELLRIWNGPTPGFFIVEEDRREEFLGFVGEAAPIVSRKVGSRQVELYRSPPADGSSDEPAGAQAEDDEGRE